MSHVFHVCPIIVLCSVDLPAPDKYLVCGCKMENDRIRMLVVLENFAPSPLNLILILSPCFSAVGNSTSCIDKSSV